MALVYVNLSIIIAKEFTDACSMCQTFKTVPELQIASGLTNHFKIISKKKLLLSLFQKKKCCGKLKCFGPLAGLLATVPANPNSGLSGSNVAGVNKGTSQVPGGSSEELSVQEGTSRTGTQARWFTLWLVKINLIV